MNNNTKYSIQDITERKNNKKSELSASKKKIQELTQNLFSRSKKQNGPDDAPFQYRYGRIRWNHDRSENI